jgi:hypothetical protein
MKFSMCAASYTSEYMGVASDAEEDTLWESGV